MQYTVKSLAVKWQCEQQLMYGLETNQIIKSNIRFEGDTVFCENLILNICKLPVVFSNRLHTTAGKAQYSKRCILLHPALNDPTDEVYHDRFNTFFHEIAHFVAKYASNHNGHGFAWQYSMMQFGFEPHRCYSPAKTPYHKHKDKAVNTIADQLLDFEV